MRTAINSERPLTKRFSWNIISSDLIEIVDIRYSGVWQDLIQSM